MIIDKPIVFTDFHHASLLQSLIMLFEGRMGGQVYRPIGMEWAEKEYWKVYDHPATQAQFLGIGSATPDGTKPLNEIDPFLKPPIAGAYFCHDIDSGSVNKAITLEAFMAIPFDIVIASLPAHIEPFKRLCAEHPNHPKLIFQIGNAWTIEAVTAPNIMASAKIENIPAGINFITYHQEFDLEYFKPDFDDLIPEKRIYSFVNCFNVMGHFASDWQLFQQIERAMQSDWIFESYGGQCRDGAIGPAEKLAAKMREARFIWHTKAGGDGYGHIIHNIAAVGRPTIVKKEYYRGKLAEELIKDGETAICIDGLSNSEIVNKIEYYEEPTRYVEMCKTIVDNFNEVCNFDREYKDVILPFLDRLQ